MASFFNPISALSMYGASPYARPSSGGYQSSLSLPTEASPYGNDIYGVDPYAAVVVGIPRYSAKTDRCRGAENEDSHNTDVSN
jgi:hypothetical protein